MLSVRESRGGGPPPAAGPPHGGGPPGPRPWAPPAGAALGVEPGGSGGSPAERHEDHLETKSRFSLIFAFLPRSLRR